MAKSVEKLTDAKVRTITAPGKYADGDGLRLQVTLGAGQAVRKSWLVRYRAVELGPGGEAVRTKPRDAGLGVYPATSLAKAREEARKLRDTAKLVDPLKKREHDQRLKLIEMANAAAVKPKPTFKQVSAAFIDHRSHEWTNHKTHAQIRSHLNNWILPVIGGLPIDKVGKTEVFAVLTQPVAKAGNKPLWEARPETYSRVRSYIERVWNHAKARELVSGDNPAALQGNIGAVISAPAKIRKPKPHVSLPHEEMAEFMATLRADQSTTALALELCILCATRKMECVEARPEEFDLAKRTWTIPAERMKEDKAHRIPLSDRAVEVVRLAMERASQDPASPFLFPGQFNRQKPLSSGAFKDLLMRLRYAADPKEKAAARATTRATSHGFRATFSTWRADMQKYSHEAAEAALAHGNPDTIAAVYNRSTYWDTRVPLMQDWADYLATVSEGV